jgi:hypothetical protein
MTKTIDTDAQFAVRFLDSAGAPVTGLTDAGAGADFSFYQLTQSGLAKTAITLASSGDYDFTEVGDGWYTVLIAGAGGASANNNAACLAWVDGKFTATAASQPVIEEVISATNSDKLDAWLGTWTAGTAQTGAAGNITLAAGDAAATDFYVDCGIVITAGTGVGQANLITANNNTTKVATVLRTWTTTPSSDSEYLIIPAWISRAFLQDGAVDADAIGTTGLDEIADAVWDELTAGHVTADTFGADNQDLATAASLTTVSNAVATVDTVVDAIKVSTDRLDDTIEDDGGVYRFTTNALEQAPTGAGSGATAQEVWEYATRAVTDKAGFSLAADQSAVTVGTVTNVTTVATVTALASSAYNAIADALLTRDWTAVTGEAARSVLNALRALRNRANLDRDAGTFTVYEEDDLTTAWSAAVTTETDAAGLSEIDPT